VRALPQTPSIGLHAAAALAEGLADIFPILLTLNRFPDDILAL